MGSCPDHSFSLCLQILIEHAGTDITDLFYGDDPRGHPHNAAAVHLLERFCVGRLAAHSSGTATSLKDGPCTQDASDFAIDESKPLLWQVGSLGSRYLEWVDSPVAGKPRFFQSGWAEAITKTPWWVVPLIWLPLVAYSIWQAVPAMPWTSLVPLILLGIVLWQGMEYSLHRFAFHLQPTTPLGIFIHFLFHGCHHKYPMDIERLVFPPVPASWIVAAVYSAVHAVAPKPVAMAVFGGIMLGYVAYDCMHYWMHSGVLGGPLKAAHMRHHYVDSTAAYGISSPLYDWLLGTMANKGSINEIKALKRT